MWFIGPQGALGSETGHRDVPRARQVLQLCHLGIREQRSLLSASGNFSFTRVCTKMQDVRSGSGLLAEAALTHGLVNSAGGGWNCITYTVSLFIRWLT